MTRLDQLAQPNRRHGEHIRAVIERQRKEQIESSMALERSASSASAKKMSRSLTHLSSGSSARSPAPLKLHQIGRSASARQQPSANLMTQSMNSGRPLRKSNATKSMTQLVTAKLLSTTKLTPTVVQARKALSFNRSPTSQQSQSHAKDSEIDSRTTNVSVSGVCSQFPVFSLCFFCSRFYLFYPTLYRKYLF